MQISLNPNQAKALADFLFDIAKGLFLGGLGSIVFLPSSLKIVIIFVANIFAVVCIRFALSLLEETK